MHLQRRRLKHDDAWLPSRTRHLVDNLAAAPIADASQSNIEIVIAAVHRCDPAGSFLGQVPE